MSLNGLFFNQLRLDIKDAKSGMSRFESEVRKLEEKLRISKKMTIQSTQAMDIYSHYYTFIQPN